METWKTVLRAELSETGNKAEDTKATLELTFRMGLVV